jgi:hypothetical protein
MPVTAEAVNHAVPAGWVLCEQGHSVCLTDEGQSLKRKLPFTDHEQQRLQLVR